MVNLVEDENFKQLSHEAFKGNDGGDGIAEKSFVDLLHRFEGLGWMRGSGGAMANIAHQQLFVSPSSISKDMVKMDDICKFDLKSHTQIGGERVSASGPVFAMIMKQTGSSSVIHTHSLAANLLTQLTSGDMFQISHQEYIKGVYDPFTGKNLSNTDTLIVPIIENRHTEEELVDLVEASLKANPRSTAVLVRRHGLYVWGPNLHKTKIMLECIEHLLELSVEMIRHGLPLVIKDDDVKISEDNYQIFFSQ